VSPEGSLAAIGKPPHLAFWRPARVCEVASESYCSTSYLPIRLHHNRFRLGAMLELWQNYIDLLFAGLLACTAQLRRPSLRGLPRLRPVDSEPFGSGCSWPATTPAGRRYGGSEASHCLHGSSAGHVAHICTAIASSISRFGSLCVCRSNNCQ
jgi:hypothetical protein